MKNLNNILLTAGVLSCSSVLAADLNINGFASIAAGKAIKTETLPTGAESSYIVNPVFGRNSDLSANESASYTGNIDFKPDTNVALQISSDLGHGLSVTTQLVAHGANDFNAEFEWAYITYQINDAWSVKAGRQRLPLYVYSDYLDVAYAYHWLRAPVEVYGESISTYEGVSITNNSYFGDWELVTQAYYGSSKSDITELGKIELHDLAGINASLSNDWLKLRASYNHPENTHINNDVNLLFTEENPGSIRFSSLGATANIGNGFIGGEWTYLTGSDLITTTAGEVGLDDRTSFMITAGYRIDDFTPHITFSSREIAFASEDIDGNGSIESPISFMDGKEQSIETLIVGVRWDFHPSAALKVEYTDSSDESSDVITSLMGEVNTVSTLALGIDLVF